LVCLDRVLTLVLELVRPDLVGEADAASFLPQIDDGAAALLVDAAQRGVQLLTAVTAQRVEGVARQTLRVHAHEHILLAIDLPLHDGDVLALVELVLERNDTELAVRRGQARFRYTVYEALVLEPIRDDLRDRDEAQSVLLRENFQLRPARHRAVRIHDLADHARRRQSGQPRQIDGRFRLTDAPQHATGYGAQRHYVAGPAQVARFRRRIGQQLNRLRPIRRADSGRHAEPRVRIHGDRERGPHELTVPFRHRREVERIGPF